MKDYTVTITLTMAIQARTSEQAQARADEVAEAIKLIPDKKAPWWWPEPDLAIEVEDDAS